MNESAPGGVILITGASGLIGSRLGRALAPRYRVVGLDKDSPRPDTAAGAFLECDLISDAHVRQALRELRAQHGERLASVIHLAAYYDFSGEPSPLYEQLTVRGTRRLLEGLADFDVEQFVFSSSILVMKPADNGKPITETLPLAAEWDYPRSKIEAEQVIAQHHGRTPAVILRIAGVYDEDCHSVPIAQQIRRIYEKRLESYLMPGNPEHGQAFVHLEDLVDCFCRVIERRSSLDLYEVFLIAEPDVMSYRELQEHIGLRLHGKEWPTIKIPAPVAKAGAWLKDKLTSDAESFIKPWMIDLADAHYPISSERARHRLGWEAQHRLRITLDIMLDRLLADPVGWYTINGLPPPA